MENFNLFSKTAQDIHNTHYEQKIKKDEEIAERRILEYFMGRLNLSANSILREINKLGELARNRYLQKLIESEKDKIRTIYEKEIKKLCNQLDKSSKTLSISALLLIGQAIVILLLVNKIFAGG